MIVLSVQQEAAHKVHCTLNYRVVFVNRAALCEAAIRRGDGVIGALRKQVRPIFVASALHFFSGFIHLLGTHTGIRVFEEP
jgi:hypothetical protein